MGCINSSELCYLSFGFTLVTKQNIIILTHVLNKKKCICLANAIIIQLSVGFVTIDGEWNVKSGSNNKFLKSVRFIHHSILSS